VVLPVAKYSDADGDPPVAQKARKIWSRVTAIPRRSRTSHPNVPNEALECAEQALLSQFWSNFLQASICDRSPRARKTLHGFARKPVFQQSPNWYLAGIVIILYVATTWVTIGTICPANTRPQFMLPEDQHRSPASFFCAATDFLPCSLRIPV
jgi:hypothetical protein